MILNFVSIILRVASFTAESLKTFAVRDNLRNLLKAAGSNCANSTSHFFHLGSTCVVHYVALHVA